MIISAPKAPSLTIQHLASLYTMKNVIFFITAGFFRFDVVFLKHRLNEISSHEMFTSE